MFERAFSSQEQLLFAEISGDYNPLHIDTVKARRLIYGTTVVHGIHAVLWAFDCWLKKKNRPVKLYSLDVDFIRALPVNVNLQAVILKESDNTIVISINYRGSKALKLKASFLPIIEHSDNSLMPIYEIDACRSVDVEELLGMSGSVDLNFDNYLADKLFPFVNRFLCNTQVAELLAITRIVGMKCPGINSLFSGLSLNFYEFQNENLVMNYNVETFDTRFSRAEVNVTGRTVNGNLYVFYRPNEKQQPSYNDVKNKLINNEFNGQRALIIGGSRGIGEVTAKLLSAGGADVVISYVRGSSEAKKIVNEINSEGGQISAIQYDVMNPPEKLSAKFTNGWQPTHLYYFATPFIFDGTKGKFDTELYNKFCYFYVDGFVKTIDSFKNVGIKFDKVFYPSSIAVEELPADMMEYSAAKVAGELICQSFDKLDNGTNFYFDRLNRLDTDQTASILQVENNDPVPCMLEILRRMS